MTPPLLTVLLLSMVTAAPDGGFTEAPGLMMMFPAWEVTSGVVVELETVVDVVWASAGAAQISADRLTIEGPNRRTRVNPRPRAELLETLWAACGEKYPVIYLNPSRRTDRSSMIVASA
jgi:hypothetical protein